MQSNQQSTAQKPKKVKVKPHPVKMITVQQTLPVQSKRGKKRPRSVSLAEEDIIAQHLKKVVISAQKGGEYDHSIEGPLRVQRAKEFMEMVANPSKANMVPSLDGFSNVVGLVSQKTDTVATYITGADGNIYGGAMFAGLLRDNLFLLRANPAAISYCLANLAPDAAGMLSEVSSMVSTQNGSLAYDTIPRALTVADGAVQLPLRDGVGYGGLPTGGSATAADTFASNTPAQLMLGSPTVLSASGFVSTSAVGNVYPCLPGDFIGVRALVSSIPGGGSVTATVQFYNSAGTALTPGTGSLAVNAGANVVNSANATIVAPATAVAFGSVTLTAVTNTVEIDNLMLFYSPVLASISAAFPSMPTCWWTGQAAHDFTGALATNITTYRPIAGSIRLTDMTPSQYANGQLAARLIEENSGPGDGGFHPFPALASSFDTYEGQLPDTPGTGGGCYAINKYNDVRSRQFRTIGRSFDWSCPYILILTVSAPTVSSQLARVITEAVYEVRTDSQLFGAYKPICDEEMYSRIYSALDADVSVGNNAGHWTRIGRFFKKALGIGWDVAKTVASVVPFARTGLSNLQVLGRAAGIIS